MRLNTAPVSTSCPFCQLYRHLVATCSPPLKLTQPNRTKTCPNWKRDSGYRSCIPQAWSTSLRQCWRGCAQWPQTFRDNFQTSSLLTHHDASKAWCLLSLIQHARGQHSTLLKLFLTPLLIITSHKQALYRVEREAEHPDHFGFQDATLQEIRVAALTATFSFKSCSSNEVRKLLEKLETNKSTGLDNLPFRMLKIAAGVLAPSLAFLFNQSISSGIVCSNWMEASLSDGNFQKGQNTTCKQLPAYLDYSSCR